jgi:hypothetical protein
MQHFCEALKSARHWAIYPEMVAGYPENKPGAGSRRLKMPAAGSN